MNDFRKIIYIYIYIWRNGRFCWILLDYKISRIVDRLKTYNGFNHNISFFIQGRTSSENYL